ncbi:MAG: hypothetical protein RL417_1866 [Pseudomonadota bacterium]|jgi:hypothetical protein
MRCCCAMLTIEPLRSLSLFAVLFLTLIGFALGGLTALAVGLAALLP